ncbi:MAG: AAA family ATPase [Deltaproteobacteria bacterium]
MDKHKLKRGLTLGKYAPLHHGHQLVIETGLAEMDEMIVLIYDAPEVTSIPLSVRAGWIRSLYPDAQVIEAWDGPTEVGYTTEMMRKHEKYIIESLGISGITHFYSSEPYGQHMSLALDAIDRRVDQARIKRPVSGQEVRGNPFVYRKLVHPRVYRDLITNVVFLGAPCTGKTTLAGTLAREFSTQWMPEYGREFWEMHQVDRRLSPDQLVEIAEEHIRREDALLLESNRYLFTDTNAMTTAVFARYYHKRVEPGLADLASQCAARYDLVFVCDTDIPYEETWDRSGRGNREVFHRQVIADLCKNKIPFIRLRGDLEERLLRVRDVLKYFHKFMNVLEGPQELYLDRLSQH